MIYLNYAATTPTSKQSLETYINVTNDFYQNMSNNKYALELQEQSREIILREIAATDHKLVYTSGGTEANNLAILGYSRMFETKKHFITTFYEHSSVYETFNQVELEGHEVTYVKSDKNGYINYNDIEKHIKNNTVMVSIMSVNNEIGTVNDIDSIFGQLNEKFPKIKTMCDNVQGFGKIKLLDLDNIDFMVISSHKIYGPKACGALVMRKNTQLKKIIHGGEFEDGLRAGLQNLASQVSFASAVKKVNENQQMINEKLEENRNYLFKLIQENDFININCNSDSNVISVRIDTVMNGESIVSEIFNEGVEVSSRSACSTKVKTSSRSLMSIGLSSKQIEKTIRVSISHLTTKKELDTLIKIIKDKIIK